MDELDEIRKRKMEKMMNDMKSPETNAPKLEFPDRPVEIGDSSIDSATMQYPVLIVDCWAEWCGPCRALAPTIEELAKELKGKVVFGKLNVDKNPLTSKRYGISAIPTLLAFKDGKLVDKVVGAYPKSSLLARIKRYI